MRLTLTLAAAGLLALAAPALAQAECTRPTAPAVVDGGTATMDQVMASKNEVQAFIAASDTYQSCLLDELNAQRTAAKAEKKQVPKSVVSEVNGKIAENQKDKETVGKAFNDTVRAYKAAHPG